MKSQDVITTINGKAIRKGQDLIDIIADSPVGTTVKVVVVRDKKPETLNVVIGDRAKIFADNTGARRVTPSGDSSDAMDVKFGMTVQALRPAERESLGYKGKGSVMIATVEQCSFADD